MMQEIVLSVPPVLEHLGALRSAVLALEVAYRDQAPRPTETELTAWGLAIYEAATNVVRHGMRPGDPRPMTLTIRPQAGRVVFRLDDHGRPNPCWGSSHARPERDSEGGYGMTIIRLAMDAIEYQPGDEGPNSLWMVARFPAGPGGAALALAPAGETRP